MDLLEKQLYNGKVFLRKNIFDESIFSALIDDDEYGYIRYSSSPKIIMDVGAYIGISSLYFAHKYPEALIYAFEPAADNYELLVKNTENTPNIVPICCAIKGRSGAASVYDIGSPLGYRISAAGSDSEGSVPCISIKEFVKDKNIDRIDLLKMDIEGSEKDVFDMEDGWLAIVESLIIELHERFLPGCNKSVFDKIDGSFSMGWVGGENFYFARNDVAVPCIPEIFRGVSPRPLPIELYWEKRDSEDINITRICKEKDRLIERLGEELEAAVAERAAVCRKKDGEIAGLQKTIRSMSEQYEKSCKEKDLSAERLGNDLKAAMADHDRVCADKDKAITELQAALNALSEQYDKTCREKDAVITSLESKV